MAQSSNHEQTSGTRPQVQTATEFERDKPWANPNGHFNGYGNLAPAEAQRAFDRRNADCSPNDSCSGCGSNSMHALSIGYSFVKWVCEICGVRDDRPLAETAHTNRLAA
tara:strand:+ start:1072 stop:1398 length:327 start_codon:yes stop_codon:yes gene_type:complete